MNTSFYLHGNRIVDIINKILDMILIKYKTEFTVNVINK